MGEAFVARGRRVDDAGAEQGGVDYDAAPGLAASYPQIYLSMGETAEKVARALRRPRARQEAFAVESQRKAAEAQASRPAGCRDRPGPRGGHEVAADGCLRPGHDRRGAGGAAPAFRADGSVTAGTSSPLTDGAAACLVTTRRLRGAQRPRAAGRDPRLRRLRLRARDHGHRPDRGHPQGARAGRLTIDDIDLMELNEAFAARRSP